MDYNSRVAIGGIVFVGIVIVLIMCFNGVFKFGLFAFGSGQKNDNADNSVSAESQKLNWYDYDISDYVPKPPSTKGTLNVVNSDLTTITVNNVSKENYEKYINECINEGFDHKTTRDSDLFEGYDDSLNHLKLEYKSGSLIITYEKAVVYDTINWSSHYVDGVVPEPAETSGVIIISNNERFEANIYSNEIDPDNYIEQCINSGFGVNASRNYYSDSIMFEGSSLSGDSLKLVFYKTDPLMCLYICYKRYIKVETTTVAEEETTAAEETAPEETTVAEETVSEETTSEEITEETTELEIIDTVNSQEDNDLNFAYINLSQLDSQTAEEILAVVNVLAAEYQYFNDSTDDQNLNWDDYDIFKDFPKPDFSKCIIVSTTDTTLAVIVHDVEPEEMKKYLKKLNNAGFNAAVADQWWAVIVNTEKAYKFFIVSDGANKSFVLAFSY